MHLRESPTYEVEIPGRIHLKVQRQLDAQGRPLKRTAAIDYFSNIIEYAENLADEVWDEDGRLRWDFSHRHLTCTTRWHPYHGNHGDDRIAQSRYS